VKRRSAEAQEQNLQVQVFVPKLMHLATLLPCSGSCDPSKVVGIHMSLYLCCTLITLAQMMTLSGPTHVRIYLCHMLHALSIMSMSTVHHKEAINVALLCEGGRAPPGVEQMITRSAREVKKDCTKAPALRQDMEAHELSENTKRAGDSNLVFINTSPFQIARLRAIRAMPAPCVRTSTLPGRVLHD